MPCFDSLAVSPTSAYRRSPTTSNRGLLHTPRRVGHQTAAVKRVVVSRDTHTERVRPQFSVGLISHLPFFVFSRVNYTTHIRARLCGTCMGTDGCVWGGDEKGEDDTHQQARLLPASTCGITPVTSQRSGCMYAYWGQKPKATQIFPHTHTWSAPSAVTADDAISLLFPCCAKTRPHPPLSKRCLAIDGSVARTVRVCLLLSSASWSVRAKIKEVVGRSSLKNLAPPSHVRSLFMSNHRAVHS